MTDREMFLNRKYYENLYNEGIISLKDITIIRNKIYHYLRTIG